MCYDDAVLAKLSFGSKNAEIFFTNLRSFLSQEYGQEANYWSTGKCLRRIVSSATAGLPEPSNTFGIMTPSEVSESFASPKLNEDSVDLIFSGLPNHKFQITMFAVAIPRVEVIVSLPFARTTSPANASVPKLVASGLFDAWQLDLDEPWCGTKRSLYLYFKSRAAKTLNKTTNSPFCESLKRVWSSLAIINELDLTYKVGDSDGEVSTFLKNIDAMLLTIWGEEQFLAFCNNLDNPSET